MTVLCCNGNEIAAKRFSIEKGGQIQKHDFGKAKWFIVEQTEVTDIRSLSSLLCELEIDFKRQVIRGEPLPKVDLSKPVRRLKHADPADKLAPYFRSAPEGIRWFCIDIDHLLLPPRLRRKPRNNQAVVRYAISQLPECFHDVTCHWQFSSAYMVTDHDNARIHLWFWLNRPVTDAEAKRWAQQINAESKLIDASLYQAVQPHYTAAPIFSDGMKDPLVKRSGLLESHNDEVAVPNIPELQRIARTVTSSAPCRGGSFDYWLSYVGDHDEGLGFHEPLLQAAWYYVLEHGSDIDVDALVDVLWSAIMEADQSRHSSAEIADRASDAHLYGLVDSAVAKLLHQEPCGLIEGVSPRYPAPVAIK